jgi:integrase
VTAIFTGMRSSELRGLTWDSVDFERNVIHVRQRADLWGTIGSPKSAAGNREIPMSPMVVNVLREWRLACPKGPLNLALPNSVGKVEAHANIANRGFYPLQIEAGIVDGEGKAKYGFHSLRHFFASWANRESANWTRRSISVTFVSDDLRYLRPSVPEPGGRSRQVRELASAGAGWLNYPRQGCN